MGTAIMVVWAIGLIGALVITLVIVKHLSLLLEELSAIRQLAEITRDAAGGLAANAGQFSSLAQLKASAEELRQSVNQHAQAVASAAQLLDAWSRR